MPKLIKSNKYLAQAKSLHETVVRRSAETSIFEGAKLSGNYSQKAARSNASIKKVVSGL